MKKLPIILSSVVLASGVAGGFYAFDRIEKTETAIKNLSKQNDKLQEDVAIQKSLNEEHLLNIEKLQKTNENLNTRIFEMNQDYEKELSKYQAKVNDLNKQVKGLKSDLGKKQ